MGFLAPVVPFLSSALGIGGGSGLAATLGSTLGRAGLSLGTSLLGSKLTGGMPEMAQGPYNQLQQAQQIGLQNAQSLLPQGQSLIGQAVSAYQPALSYLTRLAGGDRSAVAQALAPEANRIAQTFTAAQQTANQLTPRGGGRANLMTAAPYQQAQTMLDLYQQGRNQAVAQLPGVAQGIGALANPLFSAATSGLNAATSTGQSLLNFAYNQNQANRLAGQQLGQGIFDLFNPAGRQGIGGGGGGTATNPYQQAMNSIQQGQLQQAANLPGLPAGFGQPTGPLAPASPIIYNFGS